MVKCTILPLGNGELLKYFEQSLGHIICVSLHGVFIGYMQNIHTDFV